MGINKKMSGGQRKDTWACVDGHNIPEPPKRAKETKERGGEKREKTSLLPAGRVLTGLSRFPWVDERIKRKALRTTMFFLLVVMNTIPFQAVVSISV